MGLLLGVADKLIPLRPDEDVEIRFSGVRPGEKLFEELSSSHSPQFCETAMQLEKIYQATLDKWGEDAQFDQAVT